MSDSTTNRVSADRSAQDSRAAANTSFLDELLMDLPGIFVRDEESVDPARPTPEKVAAPETAAAPQKTEASQKESAPAKVTAPKRRQPIHSTLPLDIPEFREIVESFVGSMDEILAGLRAAQGRMDYQEIREVAHRLKGTGGTVGFSAFTEPSRKLQIAAEERNDATIEAMLLELEEICQRIEMPVMA